MKKFSELDLKIIELALNLLLQKADTDACINLNISDEHSKPVLLKGKQLRSATSDILAVLWDENI